MAKVVSLADYRQQSALLAGSQLWRKNFKEGFGSQSRLNDLRPHVLCWLGEPNEDSSSFFHSFIICLLGYHQTPFDDLKTVLQMQVVDIHLFLADQVRFEMMRRMGWLSRFCATQYPMFDMVRNFDHIRQLCQQDPPLLSQTHSGYQEYQHLVDRDQQVFIRRMLPSALQEFKEFFHDPDN